jgi:transcriptional regulator with XRE-family HTH domain
MSQPSFIQTFTEKTGLSQEDLASLLHISRSTVAMVCKGERSLPSHALLRLLQIEQAMDALEAPDGPTFRGMDQWKETLSFEIQKIWHRAEGMQRFINKYEARKAQWKQREKMFSVLEQQHQTTPPDEGEAKWLEMMKPLQYRYPGKDDEKYVRATILVPLLLKEAAALEAIIGEWKSSE